MLDLGSSLNVTSMCECCCVVTVSKYGVRITCLLKLTICYVIRECTVFFTRTEIGTDSGRPELAPVQR